MNKVANLIHEVVSYLTLKILVLTRFRCSITDRDYGIAIVVIVHLSTPNLNFYRSWEGANKSSRRCDMRRQNETLNN